MKDTQVLLPRRAKHGSIQHHAFEEREAYGWNPSGDDASGGCLAGFTYRGSSGMGLHNDGINILFCDGHVQWVRPSDARAPRSSRPAKSTGLPRARVWISLVSSARKLGMVTYLDLADHPAAYLASGQPGSSRESTRILLT